MICMHILSFIMFVPIFINFLISNFIEIIFSLKYKILGIIIIYFYFFHTRKFGYLLGYLIITPMILFHISIVYGYFVIANVHIRYREKYRIKWNI